MAFKIENNILRRYIPENDETEVIIPNGVTEIDICAFEYCANLKSITIPESVTKIGNYAFYKCANLKSITIPKSVTKIGNYAFGNCESLKSIVIPEGVTEIGSAAFWECTNLKSIVIPDSISEIGHFAFALGIKFIFCHNDIEVSIVPKNYWNWNTRPKGEKRLADFLKISNIDNFKKMRTIDYKYPLALLRFFGYDEREYKEYIRKNIKKIAKYIIAEENYKLINLVIENDFITKRNIDEIIEFATDEGKTEMVEILNNLKVEKNW